MLNKGNNAVGLPSHPLEESLPPASRFKAWFKRLLALERLDAMLYPAPKIKFRFRPYTPAERKRVLQIHDKHSPSRYPVSSRADFLAYLESEQKSFFVAELECGEIAACGGLTMIGPHVHVLCYDMVAPKYQGLGVGRALALVRILAGCRSASPHFGFAFAVREAFPFYDRFGFEKVGSWRSPEGEEHPIASCAFPETCLAKIHSVLQHRSHGLIPDSVPITESNHLDAKIFGGPGCYWAQIQSRSCHPSSHS